MIEQKLKQIESIEKVQQLTENIDHPNNIKIMSRQIIMMIIWPLLIKFHLFFAKLVRVTF